MARTLNLSAEEVEGEPSVVLDRVNYVPTGLVTAFGISPDGRTAIWRDSAADLPRFVWYSRSGEREGELGEPKNRVQVRFSPDGSTVVYGVDPQTGNRASPSLSMTRYAPNCSAFGRQDSLVGRYA